MRLATSYGAVSCPLLACQAKSHLPAWPLTSIVQPDKRQLWKKKVPAPSRQTQDTNKSPNLPQPLTGWA